MDYKFIKISKKQEKQYVYLTN